VGSWAGAFDGSTDEVLVPTSTIYNTQSVSIFAWINIPSNFNGCYPPIADHGDAEAQENWGLGGVGNTTKLDVTMSNVVAQFGVQSGAISTSTWHYVGFTYNGSALIGYLDGNSFGTVNVSMNIVTAPIGIGHRFANSCAMAGLIDDVRMYNRVLSAQEIQAMYIGGL
jgi:hypothetical protein